MSKTVATKRGAKVRTFECMEGFEFADGSRLAWVTWEIVDDGWGFITRRAIAVREIGSSPRQ